MEHLGERLMRLLHFQLRHWEEASRLASCVYRHSVSQSLDSN